ncbi:MAG: hypothetical protein CEN92_27 [Candidatus Berkelbacteria bacterium Licking1014_96]|uniref:Uncharacterized protein n=1 Tax=Candidatus Berkelbacteria bacterium Licking1014_96 TaxID=2017149 RepID=A0A554LI19_9BACT|nr:MAG: hypothetical protein CEN92_27 [Candidatus Berkelbacteria bacterium Licking1014_96]
METINTGDVPTPEKPKGHIRGIWTVLIIAAIAILVGGGVWYWYYKTTVQDDASTNTAKTSISPSASASASPSTLPSTSGTDETTSWKTYDSDYMTFKYPTTWKVVQNPMYPGILYENISFEINGATNPGINYFSGPYNFTIAQAISIGADTGITEVLENSEIKIDGISGKRIITNIDDSVMQGYSYSTIVPVSTGYFSAYFLTGRGDKAATTEITNKFNTLITTITIKRK